MIRFCNRRNCVVEHVSDADEIREKLEFLNERAQEIILSNLEQNSTSDDDDTSLPKVLVFLDDLAGTNLLNHSTLVKNMISNYRHLNITFFVLTQRVTFVHPAFREYAEIIILFKHTNISELKKIKEEFAIASTRLDAKRSLSILNSLMDWEDLIHKNNPNPFVLINKTQKVSSIHVNFGPGITMNTFT